jgi:thiol:disulfide interchange protein DsbD
VLDVHEGEVIITAKGEVTRVEQASPLLIQGKVTVQSCSHNQCLAPARLPFTIPIKVLKAGAAPNLIHQELFRRAKEPPSPSGAEKAPAGTLQEFGGSPRQDTLSETIAHHGLPVTLGLVFLAGLALNTTPCVYPIIPITIGFFANQAEGRLSRTSLMAASYVLGMAITYSALGVAASMTQGIFGAALQHPLVLLSLAGLMVAMALSMFGLYEFRLPAGFNRLVPHSSQGNLGALLMGLTMGIVAAPCIGPFVIGLLVHVGNKGEPVYGFFMFFVLALGLGLPYLFLGTFSGALKKLPRSGQWMVTVRRLFGLVLLGMALYFVNPLLGQYTAWALVAFLATSAAYLILVEARRASSRVFAGLLGCLGAGLGLAAVLLVPGEPKVGILWETYSEEALAQARQRGKTVMIDVYADWCLPCKELDEFTFTDPAVRSAAEGLVRLKLDLTRIEAGSQAERARERFGILGVPTILFLDSSGRERAELRLEGFESPDRFLTRIQRIGASSNPSQGSLPSLRPGPERIASLLEACETGRVAPTMGSPIGLGSDRER